MNTISKQIHPQLPAWYAVKCKYRCEKRLQEDLQAQGITAYVPIQEKWRHYISRKKRSHVALIPCHVFVHIVQESYVPILQHPWVYQFLHIANKLLPIPDAEMAIMKRVVGEATDIKVDQADWHVGDKVQIVSGELTGLHGELIARANHNFKIELKSLGLGLMIQIDPMHIIKIGSKQSTVLVT